MDRFTKTTKLISCDFYRTYRPILSIKKFRSNIIIFPEYRNILIFPNYAIYRFLNKKRSSLLRRREQHLICFILCKLAGTREHCLEHKTLSYNSGPTSTQYPLQEPIYVHDAITLMVPEVSAWSLATMNSCPSLLISFTYLNTVNNI